MHRLVTIRGTCSSCLINWHKACMQDITKSVNAAAHLECDCAEDGHRKVWPEEFKDINEPFE